MMHRLLIFAFACCLAASAVAAEQGFDPQRHMRIAEVRDGMKGYGLSVFKGTRIEKFDVEVISVLRNFTPQHDVILVRLKGANLEHTGAVAGMSGSPVYLYDEQHRPRLIGAFAMGWQLAKDPIGGVQPIEYMLAIPEGTGKPATQPAAAAPASFQPLAHAAKVLAAPGRTVDLLGDAHPSHRLRPLATPVMVSGIPQSTLKLFEPYFAAANLVPLQVGAAPAADTEVPPRIEPGGALGIPLLSGDLNMAAIGTVTEVIGNRVFAFGHQHFSEGECDLPMGPGYIHHIVASLASSFKLGAVAAVGGTLNADHAVGVSGRIGPAPKTIPIALRCIYEDGTLDRTYRFNVVNHPRLTPLLSALATVAAVTGNRELPQHHTLDYDLALRFAGDREIRLRNRIVDGGGGDLLMAVAPPILAASDNPFQRIPLERIEGVVRVGREARSAELLSASLPRTRYRPGQTVKAMVRYRPFQGAEAILPLSFDLPAGLANGEYELAIMDAEQYLTEEQMARPFRFSARSADEVVAVLRDAASVRRDALYLRLQRGPDGVAIGRAAMPHLPSSRRQVMLGAGRSDIVPFVTTTLSIVPTDYVFTGQASFTLTIDNTLRKDPQP